ncbi:hypothetical protein [Streptomyces sp. NPDC001315]|uniref:hypothetical protein n=1 Tax=Streptomyces sp. NPDC001315 TaxID=3364562 RepID=UPI0036A64D19
MARSVPSTVAAAARAAAANRATVRMSVQPHPGPSTVASTSRLTASNSARAEAASGTAAPLGRRTSGSSSAPGEKQLFAGRPFTAATVALFLFSAGFAIVLLSTALFMQEVWHFGPLRAGVSIAPAPWPRSPSP